MDYKNNTHGNVVTNQGTNNNGINRSSLDNRRASPNGWVYPEMESQGPGGHHQATSHNRGQEDAAEMGPTEARPRKRYTKDEKKKICR